MSNYGLGAYKKTSVHTASKEQILLMLYQTAIKHCKMAIEATEKKQVARKGESIGKLQDIIIELNNSLDFSVGGNISKELSSLYDYMLYATTQANIKMDVSYLNSCLSVLNTLYEGWSQAIKQIKQENAAGTNAGGVDN